MTSKLTRMIRTLPSYYRAETSTYLRGILSAWAISDEEITVQIKEAKNEIFVKKSDGKYLDRNANNYGVERSAELGIDDDDFRNLVPILSTYPKQVRATIISLFEVFWGPGFTRANINSGNNEVFNFGSPNALLGTMVFTKGERTVLGTSTSFLSEVQVGDFIRPTGFSDKTFARVAKIVSNVELELSFPWELDTIAIVGGVSASSLTLSYIADRSTERSIRFFPNAFEDLSSISAKEIADFINRSSEHSQYLEGDVFFDPLSGNKLNIRTKTPGLQGSVQITGGTANAPSILNFPLTVASEIKAAVYELNPNEIVVQIPSSVPVLRRSLKGSWHPKKVKTVITSVNEPYNFAVLGSNSTLTVEVDQNPYTVIFNHSTDFKNSVRASALEVTQVINKQLTFLKSFTDEPEAFNNVGLRTTEGSSEYRVTGGTANGLFQFPTALQMDPDVIQENYPSAYLFDPTGQLYTVTGTNAKLVDDVGQGSTQSTIAVDNAANFPNVPGLLLFDFGRSQQEGPVRYNSRPNNSTLLIDASHIFQKNHFEGRYVNLIADKPTIPRVTGDDYPIFIVGTTQARIAAQTLIRRLIAAGVIIRFIIEFPEVLFEVTITVPDSPDQFGSLTAASNPPFLT